MAGVADEEDAAVAEFGKVGAKGCVGDGRERGNVLAEKLLW